MLITAPRCNALTVDVEDYFHVAAFDNTISAADWENLPQRVERNTDILLQHFADNNATATFFILGWVAQRFPDLVKRIQHGGHEVASHGFSHAKATVQTPDAFLQDITQAKQLLEDLTGEAVIGYRAPSFSIGKTNEWAFDCLQQAGYLYSSSTYPVVHDLYGTPDWPQKPYRRPEGIWEYPMPVWNKAGKQLPVAGGGYFRLLPYWLSKKGIDGFLQQSDAPYMFYFHPWEIDPEQPRFNAAPFKSKFRHYTNLNRMENKLLRLLKDYQWRSVRQIFQP